MTHTVNLQNKKIHRKVKILYFFTDLLSFQTFLLDNTKRYLIFKHLDQFIAQVWITVSVQKTCLIESLYSQMHLVPLAV